MNRNRLNNAIISSLLVLMVTLTACSGEIEDRSPGHTIAVYYWPNFHPDPFHQSKKGEGWTEWEIVKNAKPKFEGHYQPKVPLWGYRDESDPKEMARSIDAMADAGIDVVIFDWYRYDEELNNGEMIEGALRKGFLKAPNRDRLKFALMWANHTYVNCHPFTPGKGFDNAEVWHRGEVSAEAFRSHTDDAIKSYFKQPNYWKIDGKPYFSIYQLEKLVEGLGGIEATRAALDDFRERTRAAGFSGLHLNIIDFNFRRVKRMAAGQSMPGDPSRKIVSENDLMEALGADSVTWYTWVQQVNPSPDKNNVSQSNKEDSLFLPDEILMNNASEAGIQNCDYMEWGNRSMSIEMQHATKLKIPLFPHVSRGWDGSPRNYGGGIVVGNTPERFKYFLNEAKKMSDTLPESKGIITINSWNEWVEGSYLEPDTETGMKPLEMIREVFGNE